MYTLYIANKNYSSWSLRPWLLLKQLGIDFQEELVPFGEGPVGPGYRAFSPSGRLPSLHDKQRVIWDSLAITEYLAERHTGIWPADDDARAWARSAAAEMHSGFTTLREICSMDCGFRIRLHTISAALQADLDRLEALWAEGLNQFGGPYLAGAELTAVDAFFAPIALRAKTYHLDFGAQSRAYLDLLLANVHLSAWEADALQEPWREPAHERDALASGVLLRDLRKPV